MAGSLMSNLPYTTTAKRIHIRYPLTVFIYGVFFVIMHSSLYIYVNLSTF